MFVSRIGTSCKTILSIALVLSLSACFPREKIHDHSKTTMTPPPGGKHQEMVTTPHNHPLANAAILKKFKQDSMTVNNGPDGLVLALPERSNFTTKSSKVNKVLKKQLNDVARMLLQYPYALAQIKLRMNQQQKDTMKLAEQRTTAITDYLEAQGIPSNRLSPIVLTTPETVAKNAAQNKTAKTNNKNKNTQLVTKTEKADQFTVSEQPQITITLQQVG